MTEVKAKLSNYRQSPRKVRLVATLIRGKKVGVALQELKFLNKRASNAVKKLLESAVANAKHNNNLKEENLFLKEIAVNEGPSMKRFKPGARGSAYPFKKRTSHITLTLGEMEAKKETKVKKVTK